MTKMYFPTWVKYNGGKYPPHTAFEVRDEDVTDLQKAGGWIIEEPKPVIAEPIDTTEEKVAPKKKRAKKQEE